MSNPDWDGIDLSMYLYGTLKERLVTRDTALAFAMLLIGDRFGAEEVDHQHPISIHAEGDTWVIRGSGEPNWNDGHDKGAIRHGKAEVVISQFDGQILKLTLEAPLPPHDQGGSVPPAEKIAPE